MRTSLIVIACMCICSMAIPINMVEADESEIALAKSYVAQKFSGRLVQCQTSWFTKRTNIGPAPHTYVYTEYKNLKINAIPHKITEVDKLNGIEWSISVSYDVSGPAREYDTKQRPSKWYPWKNNIMKAAYLVSKKNGKIIIEDDHSIGKDARDSFANFMGKLLEGQPLSCSEGPIQQAYPKDTSQQPNSKTSTSGSSSNETASAEKVTKKPGTDTSWSNNPSLYVSNTKIQELLKRDNIRIGISKEEAMRIYDFDIMDKFGCLTNQKILDEGNMPAREGISQAHIAPNGKVDRIEKIISIENGEVNFNEIQRMFINKYGREGLHKTGLYFIKSDTNYLMLKLDVFTSMARKPPRAWVKYNVYDNTEKVMKELQDERVKQDELDRSRSLKDKL